MNKNRSLHDNFYFVDQKLGIPTRKHLTNEALAVIFTVAAMVNSSYASIHAIPGVTISKQTVSNYQKRMNTLIGGEPTVEQEYDDVEKEIDVIYIEADEAHCNLQNEVSIDDSSDEIKTTTKSKKKVKKNNIINKLSLVHSGHKNPDLLLKRHELDNKYYFGGIHMPPTNIADNISLHIYKNYDLKKVKYIFVSGDGANWIKSLYRELKKIFESYNIQVINVLDKYHFKKCISSIFNHDNFILKSIQKNIDSLTANDFKKKNAATLFE